MATKIAEILKFNKCLSYNLISFYSIHYNKINLLQIHIIASEAVSAAI